MIPFHAALTLMLSALPALPEPAPLCDAAARRAAQRHGVPEDLMLAITRAETGRQGPQGLQPWPWAINLGGNGQWPEDKISAETIAQREIDAGHLNIDIGCFQLNLRWHSKGFASLDEMFDPAMNADYAARFLVALREETGSWEAAAGAYHSRNEDLAAPYAARIAELIDSLPAGEGPPPPARENRFPLLQAGLAGRNGSLVPQLPLASPLLGAGS